MEMTEYQAIKKNALERFFARSNPQQKQAIFHTDGALLIIAGAGSGKTTVLCGRTANLILFGKAYGSDVTPDWLDGSDGAEDNLRFIRDYAEGKADDTAKLAALVAVDPVRPYRILEVTFTNKAAKEIKQRLSDLGAYNPYGGVNDVWAGTFHSICMRILRQEAEALTYTRNFTIYDTDDSVKTLRGILSEFNLPDGVKDAKHYLNVISAAKDKLISPGDYKVYINGGEDPQRVAEKKVYGEYTRRLLYANAMDFDDLIYNTVRVFMKFPDTLRKWASRFDYIMVDEYQDTNHAQYKLLSLLADKRNGGSGNFCVVGDDDQSIYGFRGATIKNILSFGEEFNAVVIKLEQNYRSTGTILNAANAVIKQNKDRLGKELRTAGAAGDKVYLNVFSNEKEEATYIINEIRKDYAVSGNTGGKYADSAILYRNNAQSMSLETAFIRGGIPYRIVGGLKFFDRKEVKDILAYLSLIVNPFDTVRFSRIVNEPRRGIGDTTQVEIFRLAALEKMSPLDICKRSGVYPGLSKKTAHLVGFATIIDDLTEFIRGEHSKDDCLADLIDYTLERTTYNDMLRFDEKRDERLQNIGELKSHARRFAEELDTGTAAEAGTGATAVTENSAGLAQLAEFLEATALISDLDIDTSRPRTDGINNGIRRSVDMGAAPVAAADGGAGGDFDGGGSEAVSKAVGDDKADKVVMMTVHSAKGLEFKNVFLVGAEENIFPSFRCIEPAEIEEERRLAYVAYTRAKERLYITTCKQRMLYGRSQSNKISRFVGEIPDSLVTVNDASEKHDAATASARPTLQRKNYLQEHRNADAASKTDLLPAGSAAYAAGDRVKHKKFGEGVVVSAVPLGSDDFLAEIHFDSGERRKIGARFAQLVKL